MVGWILTGGLVPPLLMACGLFFLLYLRFLPFRRPKEMAKALVASGEGGVSSYRALMQALAGTLGVGNVVGVASAIRIGGAGAVFWMWISALLAMILKYAETVLALLHRRVASDGSFFGGAVYYIKDYFDTHRRARLGVFLSAVFAALMITDALSMGCMIQANAVGGALSGVLEIPAWVTGGVLVACSLPLFKKGCRGISALTECLVPIMTAGYLILSVAVLILRWDGVGDAFASIFREALSPASVGGGVFGFLSSDALRVGTMRGLLSNEAGCGTAPTAHAQANAKSPATQGVWGIFEVFADTILLCTATALVILVTYGSSAALFEGNAVMLTVTAYSSVLGGFSELFFCAALLCFGYATLICWGGYGLENVRFLSARRQWRWLYLAAFAVCTFVGCAWAPSGVWAVSDFAIGALTVINLAVLLLSRREILLASAEMESDEPKIAKKGENGKSY